MYSEIGTLTDDQSRGYYNHLWINSLKNLKLNVLLGDELWVEEVGHLGVDPEGSMSLPCFLFCSLIFNLTQSSHIGIILILILQRNTLRLKVVMLVAQSHSL